MAHTFYKKQQEDQRFKRSKAIGRAQAGFRQSREAPGNLQGSRMGAGGRSGGSRDRFHRSPGIRPCKAEGPTTQCRCLRAHPADCFR